MKTRGSITVLFLPLAALFFFGSVLVWDMGLWEFTSERVQTVADAALLSSLRLRVEALQKISDRWLEFGQFFLQGWTDTKVLVPAAQWNFVQSKADSLKKAIPGYKGRITSVIGVVAEANGYDKEAAFFDQDLAQNLGIVPEPVTLLDESGHTKTLPAGWYRRQWAPLETAPQPPEESIFHVILRSPMAGRLLAGEAESLWRGNQISEARLRWDVDQENPVVILKGNGGFPRDWAQALDGVNVQPHRFPFYEARLKIPGGAQ